MFVSGLLLAAGASSRFGSPKMLAPFGEGGTPLLQAVCETWRRAGLDELLIVLGSGAADIRATLEENLLRKSARDESSLTSVRFVENPSWEFGMFSSVRYGLAALSESSSTHIAVSPADIPFLSSTTLRTILDATALPEADSRTLLVPVCGRRRGHPLVIPAALCPRLLSWPDTARLNRIFAEPDVKVLQLEGFDDSILHDVDLRGDLVKSRPAPNA